MEWASDVHVTVQGGSDAWSGWATGILTGLITGAVAFGLFYAQRRVDRNTARDQRTQDAVNAMRAASETFLFGALERGKQEAPITLDSFQDWAAQVWLNMPRIPATERALSRVVSDAYSLRFEYARRTREIQATYPLGQDSYGNDVINPAERKAQMDVCEHLVGYVDGFQKALAEWSPDSRDITAPDIPNVLTHPWLPPSGGVKG